MRTHTIVAVLAAAVGLGLLTGEFVLPARAHSGAAPAASRNAAAPPGTAAPASPAPSSATPAPTPASGPMAEQHLLTAGELRAVGFTRHLYIRDRVGDGRYANAACAGEKTLGETLGGPNAHFRGLTTSRDADADDPTLALRIEDQVAREVAADAGSPSLAQNFAERLLLEEVPCQHEPAAHWVYGPAHTVGVAAGISGTWMGYYDGRWNTTGTAPQGREPCGGIAVLRNGSHFAVLEVDACLDTAALTGIVRAAVTRL